MSITKISPSVVDFDSALVVSPTLTIGDATAEDTKIVFDGNAQDYYIGLDDSADDFIIGLGSTVGTTPAIVIDTSGNLLVGTINANPTSSSVNDAGVELSNTGGVRSTVASNPAATFNRKTDDGNIAIFRKDGTTVGSINVLSSRLGIGTGDTGIFFDATASNAVEPFNTTTNATSDGLVNLGSPSTQFLNLYLSGGVVFDAVAGGATSNTLDDYEEGSFTIGVSGTTATLDNTTAYYTKIGRLVYWFWYSGNSTFASSSSTATLTGLPFHQDGLSANYGLFQYVHGNAVDGDSTGGYINNNGTSAFFIDAGSFGGATFIDGSTKFIMVQGIYQTDQ